MWRRGAIRSRGLIEPLRRFRVRFLADQRASKGTPGGVLRVIAEKGIAPHVLHLLQSFGAGLVDVEGMRVWELRDRFADIPVEITRQIHPLFLGQELPDDRKTVAVEIRFM